MSTSNTTAIGDPREAALARARALYPQASLVELVAVAEFLLRPIPQAAPVLHPQLVPPAIPSPPWIVTCGPGGSGGSAGQATYIATDASDALWKVSTPGGFHPTIVRPDDDGTAGVLARVG